MTSIWSPLYGKIEELQQALREIRIKRYIKELQKANEKFPLQVGNQDINRMRDMLRGEVTEEQVEEARQLVIDALGEDPDEVDDSD